MFLEINMKCPNDFAQVNSAFEKLVRMQHYSLPTKLLDLTANPLAALFFAVKENLDKDAEVLIFHIPKTGKVGVAVSLVCADELDHLRSIERLTNKILERLMVAGFEPLHPLPDTSLTAPRHKPQGAKRKPTTGHRDGVRSGELARGYRPARR